MTALHENITSLTAGFILGIDLGEPERLFTGDADTAKSEFRELARAWHPDISRNPLANDVMVAINKLYDQAVSKLTAGTWHIPGQLEVTSFDGTTYRVKYRKMKTFELGDMYIGNTVIAYIVAGEHKRLYEQFVANIKNFKFADDKMQKEMRRYLPMLKKDFKTIDGRYAIVLSKTPEMINLGDLIEHLGGKVEPKHAAWMISRLNNLACYLQYSGLTHNDISVETCFVSPEFHTISLIGGWWYSVPKGSKLLGMTGRAFNLMTDAAKKKKVGDTHLDHELVRATARQILGDSGFGSKLMTDKAIPAPMVSWVRDVASADAFKDFKSWDGVLTKSFGERKFIKMNITPDDVYDK